MKLEDCTKDELIWMVKRVAALTSRDRADYYVSLALRDLEFERQKRASAEAHKIAEKAKEKWDESFAALAPYKGQKFSDIPFEVLLKAKKAQKEALALYKKWDKLMGVTDDA